MKNIEAMNAAKKTRTAARAALTRAKKTADPAKVAAAEEACRAAEAAYAAIEKDLAANAYETEAAADAAEATANTNAADNHNEGENAAEKEDAMKPTNAAEATPTALVAAITSEAIETAKVAALTHLYADLAAKAASLKETAERAAKEAEAAKNAAHAAEEEAEKLRAAVETDDDRAAARAKTLEAEEKAAEAARAAKFADAAEEAYAAFDAVQNLTAAGEDLFAIIRYKTDEERAFETVAAEAAKKRDEVIAPHKARLEAARAAVQTAKGRDERAAAVIAENEAAAILKTEEKRAATKFQNETRAARKAAEGSKEAAPRVVFSFGLAYTAALEKRPSAALQAAHNAAAFMIDSLKIDSADVAQVSVHFNAASNPQNVVSAARCVAKKVAAHSVEKQGTPTQVEIDRAARCGAWNDHDLADMVSEAASTICSVVAAGGDAGKRESMRREAKVTLNAAGTLKKLATADRAARSAVVVACADTQADREARAAVKKAVGKIAAGSDVTTLEKCAARLAANANFAAKSREIYKVSAEAFAKRRREYVAANSDGREFAEARAAEREAFENLAATKCGIVEDEIAAKKEVQEARAAVTAAEAEYEKKRGEAEAEAKKEIAAKLKEFKNAAKEAKKAARAADKEFKAAREDYATVAAEYNRALAMVHAVEVIRKTDPRRAIDLLDERMERYEEAREHERAAHKKMVDAMNRAEEAKKGIRRAEDKAKEYEAADHAAKIEEAADLAARWEEKKLEAAKRKAESVAAEARNLIFADLAACKEAMILDGASGATIAEMSRAAYNEIVKDLAPERYAAADAAFAKASKRRAVEQVKYNMQKLAAGERFDNSEAAKAENKEVQELAAKAAAAEGFAANARDAYSRAARNAAAVPAPQVCEDENRTKARGEVMELIVRAADAVAKASTIEEKARAAEKTTNAAYRAVNNYLTENRGVRAEAVVAPLSWDDLTDKEADPRLIVDGEGVAAEYTVIRRNIIRAAYAEVSGKLTAAQKKTLRALYRTCGNTACAARLVKAGKGKNAANDKLAGERDAFTHDYRILERRYRDLSTVAAKTDWEVRNMRISGAAAVFLKSEACAAENGIHRKTVYQHLTKIQEAFAAAVMSYRPESMEAAEFGLQAVAAVAREKAMKAAEAKKAAEKKAAAVKTEKAREAHKKKADRAAEIEKAAGNRAEYISVVEKAIAALPAKMREVAIFAARNPEISGRAAAVALGKSEATYREAKKRAAELLKKAIVAAFPKAADKAAEYAAAGDIASLIGVVIV